MAMPAHQEDETPAWAIAWAQAARTSDALLFATGVLGFLKPGAKNPDDLPQLDKWQVQALKLFSKGWANRFKKPPRLAIKSGHGVGKTCFLSIIILFVLLCSGPDTKIPVVANSMDQLRDALWPEIKKWLNVLPEELRVEIDWQKEKVVIKSAPEEAFAVARTASKHRPEALQGMHAKTVLVIFEEASGIPEETVETGQGSLSTKGAGHLCVGNPTRASGFFHKIFTVPALRATWERMTVNCEDVPRAQGHIDSVIALYGKDSNKYRVRVKGEFPTKDDDVVIPLEWIEASKGRKVAISHVFPVWGIDVARFGDDRITLLKRQGNTLLKGTRVWRNLDGKQVAGRVMADYRATEIEMRPKAICVDVLGVGYSVYDHMNNDPTLLDDDVQVIGVNVAESASSSDLYHRLRDELWFSGRRWFQGLDVCIDIANMNEDELAVIEQLIGELAAPTYDFAASGKQVVMSKEDMKKEVGQSPDLADGFLVTFAASVFPRPIEDGHRRRHRRDDYETGGALAA